MNVYVCVGVYIHIYIYIYIYICIEFVVVVSMPFSCIVMYIEIHTTIFQILLLYRVRKSGRTVFYIFTTGFIGLWASRALSCRPLIDVRLSSIILIAPGFCSVNGPHASHDGVLSFHDFVAWLWGLRYSSKPEASKSRPQTLSFWFREFWCHPFGFHHLLNEFLMLDLLAQLVRTRIQRCSQDQLSKALMH